MRLVAPRQRIPNDFMCEIGDSEKLADKLLDMIGTESFEELERRAEMENDPAAMLKLGDFLMCAIKMKSNDQRDPDRACEYYYRAAGFCPEGHVAQALLCYGCLTQDCKQDPNAFGLNMVRIPPNKVAHTLHGDMWRNLEHAANQGYNCPFMMMMVKINQNQGFTIPRSVEKCYYRRIRDVANERNTCSNSECRANPKAEGYKLLVCARCRCKKYCR